MEKVHEDINYTAFVWARAGSMYKIDGSGVFHKGGGVGSHRPVVGSLEMGPGEGKFYYEIVTNTDNCKLGVCMKEAFLKDSDFEEAILGKVGPADKSTADAANFDCWVLNCQTSTVEYRGTEKKKLWRMFVPVCGARFGFLVDTNKGIVQLYMNDEYQGVLFDSSLGLEGITLLPCVGICGMDMNNNNIINVMKSACVTPVKKLRFIGPDGCKADEP